MKGVAKSITKKNKNEDFYQICRQNSIKHLSKSGSSLLRRYLRDADPINLKVVQCLVKGGNCVNAGNLNKKDCPLHVALMNQTVTAPTINYLIDAGANLEYISQDSNYSLLMIYLKSGKCLKDA